MQYEIGELSHEGMFVEFGVLAEFIVKFLDGEAIEVGEEEGGVVFL